MPRAVLATMTCLVLALPGCTRFPELDSAITAEARDAGYPELLPTATLAAMAAEPAREPDDQVARDPDEARAARLRARAARLRGAVIDADTQSRMKEGVK